jgi:hypothetical protein
MAEVTCDHDVLKSGCLKCEVDDLKAEVAKYKKRKDEAFEERNRVVACLARMVVHYGGTAGVAQHVDTPGVAWDSAWRTLVMIDLPTGQASWHAHDSHAHVFDGLPVYVKAWDGHTTPAKYERVDRAFRAFKPSQVELRNVLLFGDDQSDREVAQALAVLARACQVCDDRWQPIAAPTMGRILKSDADAGHEVFGRATQSSALFQPDFHGLVERRLARWASGDVTYHGPLELTADGLATLQAWVTWS